MHTKSLMMLSSVVLTIGVAIALAKAAAGDAGGLPIVVAAAI